MKTGEWMSLTAVAAELGVTKRAVRKMMELGAIGTKRFPGVPPKYRRADVERLKAESVRPAGSVTAG